MTQRTCHYPNREETLAAVLYDDDLSREERTAFEAHLAACALCSVELRELRAMRVGLQQWAPPEPARALSFQVTPIATRRTRTMAALREVPFWAQTAAALLCLGVAAGIANLHVTVGQAGFSVRTGWSAPATPAQNPAGASQAGAVTQEQLASLAAALRQEIATSTEAVPQAVAAALSNERTDVLRETRNLVAENRRFQMNELALRIADVREEDRIQRTSDQRKLDQYLRFVDLRTRQIDQGLNNLVQRTSSTGR